MSGLDRLQNSEANTRPVLAATAYYQRTIMSRYILLSLSKSAHCGWLPQVPTEVNNRVQILLLNYHFALLSSGDFTLVYYQMGELEYIHLTVVQLQLQDVIELSAEHTLLHHDHHQIKIKCTYKILSPGSPQNWVTRWFRKDPDIFLRRFSPCRGPNWQPVRRNTILHFLFCLTVCMNFRVNVVVHASSSSPEKVNTTF